MIKFAYFFSHQKLFADLNDLTGIKKSALESILQGILYCRKTADWVFRSTEQFPLSEEWAGAMATSDNQFTVILRQNFQRSGTRFSLASIVVKIAYTQRLIWPMLISLFWPHSGRIHLSNLLENFCPGWTCQALTKISHHSASRLLLSHWDKLQPILSFQWGGRGAQ